MGKSGDLYDVLGVAKDASPQDIKKAFRVKARECHPDVAGNDPQKAEAFKKLREAYEVLADPVERARYDRRGEKRTNPFYGSNWSRGTVNVGGAPPSSTGTRAAGNDLDLEDIFNDFSGVGDFGFTGQTRGQPAGSPGGGRFKGAAPSGRAGARPGAHPTGGTHGRTGGSGHGGPSGGNGAGASGPGPTGPGPGPGTGHGGTAGRASSTGARPDGAPRPRPGPVAGRDISVPVDVPAHVASAGGTVTVTYVRLRRADDGHTLYRYDELHDLKVPPGTRHGETLRVARMGDAGLEGGAYGDLVADVRITGARAESRGAAWEPEDVPSPDRPPSGNGPGDAWSFGEGSFGEGSFGEGSFTDGGARRKAAEGRTSAWNAGGWTRGDGEPAAGPRPRFQGRGDAAGVNGAANGPAAPDRDADTVNGAGHAEGARRDTGRMRMPGHEAPTTADGAVRVDVGVVAALLGGRVTVQTPAGAVRVNIPAGTSSGTRMRLRGRGAAGPDGQPTDLVAEVRIVVPKELDDESRRLIERFAELNREEE